MTTPFYEADGVTIYHAETLNTLKALACDEHQFDLIMADPPYGETSIKWDHWQREFPSVARLVLAPGGSMWCFGSMRMFLANAYDFRDWKFAQDVVWEKHNGSIFHADRFRRVHEHVVQWYADPWESVYKSPQFTQDATKRTVRRKERPPHTGEIANSTYTSEDGGPRLMRSVLQFRSCHGTAVHPTQKPEGLVRTLMRYSLRPGGTVLVPYMGSGTDVLIAREMGARVIAIEGREEYCRAAVQRLQQSVMQFDEPATRANRLTEVA